MLSQPTLEKLFAMRLGAMAHAWEEQQKLPDIAALGFDERFGLLVEAEHIQRENKRLHRRLGEAKLRISKACVEDIDYPARRGLDKAQVLQLATCRWIEEHQSILVTGATGTGKTYVACALAQRACRRGYRVLYRRLPRLLHELALARADGTYSKLLIRLARVDVLVVDDWAIAPLTEPQRHDMLEVFEDRYGLRSSLLTSQLPIAKWHDHVGDPSIADAILDRLVHGSHRIALKGPSCRKEENEKQ